MPGGPFRGPAGPARGGPKVPTKGQGAPSDPEEHELFFGDEAAQQEHHQAVAAAGGVPFDSPDGIAVRAGQTREFTYTFEYPGRLLAGCHVPGHYTAGMKASVAVR